MKMLLALVCCRSIGRARRESSDDKVPPLPTAAAAAATCFSSSKIRLVSRLTAMSMSSTAPRVVCSHPRP